jgi:hypothetical protein
MLKFDTISSDPAIDEVGREPRHRKGHYQTNVAAATVRNIVKSETIEVPEETGEPPPASITPPELMDRAAEFVSAGYRLLEQHGL